MSTHQDLIHVSGGNLVMGSDGFYPEESPSMRVLIDDLWIRSTLVTNAEFSTFVTSTGYVTTAEREDRQGSVVFVGTPGPVPLNDWRQWWAWQPGANWRHPQGPNSSLEDRLSHPVVHVSLHDARAYATWAGLEIPHEPEWEWCARGGLESATYTWGEEPNKGDELFANTWQGNPDGTTTKSVKTRNGGKRTVRKAEARKPKQVTKARMVEALKAAGLEVNLKERVDAVRVRYQGAIACGAIKGVDA